MTLIWRRVAAALTLGAALVLGGCLERYELRVPLEAAEGLNEGDPVFIDGRAGGEIDRFEQGAEGRLAVVRISADEPVRARLRSGVFRDGTAERINIVTAGVDQTAAPLPSGALLPRSAGLPAALRVFGRNQTLAAAGMALALVVVFTLVFRFFYNVAFILATLALAAGLAWASVPFAAPEVERFYARSPQVISAVPAADPGGAGLGTSARELLVERPDPVLLSFGVLTFGYFIILTLALGKAVGSFVRPK